MRYGLVTSEFYGRCSPFGWHVLLYTYFAPTLTFSQAWLICVNFAHVEMNEAMHGTSSVRAASPLMT